MLKKFMYILALCLIVLTLRITPASYSAGGTTYYVSSSTGSAL